MLDRIFFLHSKITKDQVVRIVLVRENWEVQISKSDLIKSDDNMITIFRANGNITVVNPNHVIMACTMDKRSVY